MTAPAPRGHHSTDLRVLPDYQGDEASDPHAQFHPDVLAAARAMGGVTDYKLRRLQRQYDRATADADADHDFGGHVLTMHDKRTRQTRPVDLAVGERATRRLDRSTR